MKPVLQTDLGRNGNCLSACFASLFECPITEVPNFYHIAGDDDAAWWGAVRDWLRVRGFGLMTLPLLDEAALGLFEGFFIVSGKSCRGLDHATIWQSGKMIHDPHPSQCGIIKPEYVDMLYPLNPAKLSQSVTA